MLRISRLADSVPRPLAERAISTEARRLAKIAVALGDRERATALLHEYGYQPGLHWAPPLEPLWDYPPFQEFLRPKG